jgi:hypothetical protein
MSKYDRFSQKTTKPRPWKIHPIWRGIGCFLLILVPIVAYAGGELLIAANQQQGWFPLPAEMLRAISLPLLGRVPHLIASVVVTLLLSFAGFGILTVFYALVYQLFGPPRLGPMDAPPIRARNVRKSR